MTYRMRKAGIAPSHPPIIEDETPVDFLFFKVVDLVVLTVISSFQDVSGWKIWKITSDLL